jgi:hypothetical protein
MNMRRIFAVLVVVGCAALVVPPALADGPATGQARAGVGVADATWNVGSNAGQYASDRDVGGEAQGGGVDPNMYSVKDQPSYGVQSRLQIRALVVQGANGTKVAMVKADNYLAQDSVQRRVEQLLDPSLGITRHNLFWSATHDHSSPYTITPAAGVQLFQDAFDLRMFEYEARQAAKAITFAATHTVPVRMGATKVHHTAFKGNIVGPQLADDGTPAGYPNHFGDFDLTVLRFDDITNKAKPRPLATWVNWGEHPESLDGYNLITADYISALQRDVDRATGSTMVFSQGDVGSSEGPYDHTFAKPEQLPDGVYREWAHMGYAQMERGAYELAQSVIAGWRQIGGGDKTVVVPYSTSFPVGVAEDWAPGPVSHPYPSVSNCRTQPTLDGDPGAPILGLPDCQRAGTGVDAPVWESLRESGIPVPDHYDAPAFGGVEENLRIHLQAVRLGDVLLASCSCEAQVDLILNLKSRTDAVNGDIWNGYPWDQYCDPVAGGATYKCENPRTDNPADRSLTISKAAFDHMKAEIHNDAKGWDDPSYAVQANVEPTDPTQIKGNFTKQELQDVCSKCSGFKLPVGLGHTGDYDGYTVSYREYMNRDSYRKALTSYGPHTADYMVTRLVKMAASLQGGPPVPADTLDAAAQADEARAEAQATVLGEASSAAYDGYAATLPDDVGPAGALSQPKNIDRFSAATFSWVGGSNAIDNPNVVVQRRLPNGAWTNAADQQGEVETFLALPSGFQSIPEYHAGQIQWKWTANFEAFDPFPAGAASQVVNGVYRFVVDGNIHQSGAAKPYHLESQPFSVSPWGGIQVNDLRLGSGGSVSFAVPPIAYPRTYTSTAAPKFIADDHRTDVCKTCSFRPWASTASVASAVVTVVRASGAVQHVSASLVNGRWVASTALQPGDRAFVDIAGVHDTWGEINGAPSANVTG